MVARNSPSTFLFYLWLTHLPFRKWLFRWQVTSDSGRNTTSVAFLSLRMICFHTRCLSSKFWLQGAAVAPIYYLTAAIEFHTLTVSLRDSMLCSPCRIAKLLHFCTGSTYSSFEFSEAWRGPAYCSFKLYRSILVSNNNGLFVMVNFTSVEIVFLSNDHPTAALSNPSCKGHIIRACV